MFTAIRSHFAGLLAALLLLTVLAGAVLLLGRDRTATLEAVMTAQGNMALGLEREILRNIDIYDLSLRAAASGLRLLGGTSDPDVQNAILFDGATAARYFRPIVIADASGTVVRDAGAVTPRVANVADRLFFEAHRSHDDLGVLIRLMARSSIDGRPYLSITRPVRSADGRFDGIVAGGLDLAYFRDIFSRFALPAGGAIALIGDDGRMVAGFPFRDDAVASEIRGGDLVRHAMRDGPSSFETSGMLDGVARVATVRRLGSLPFVLAIGTPLQTVYADWRVRAWFVTAGVLAFVALSSVLLVALWRELRRRRQAERSGLAAAVAAAAGEMRLNTYVDHLADGILALRRDAAGRFVHERLNAAAAAMLGVTVEDAIDRTAEEVWPGAFGQFMAARWQECLAAVSPLQFERSHETRAGARVLRFVVAPVQEWQEDGTAAVTLLLASVRDVTATVDLEARLRQADRLEAVGQLTAGVAHDFNNMLQAQLGALELLIDQVADRPHARELADVARNACEHGARLTHSLMSFSRQQHLAPQAVPIAAMLDQLKRKLSRTLGPLIDLHVAAEPDMEAPFADAAQLEAALLNIALNARDAMPDGGVLRMEARRRRNADPTPGDAAPDAAALLVVSDTGQGMRPDIVARACEPFFTTKPVGKGTGLGLSMVQGFVEQSGGMMRILSTPGRGTRVELVLPAITTPAETCLADTGRRTKCRSAGRILLVDDMPEVLAVTAELLEDAGFEVTTATQGEEALSLLAAGRPFDILVTDYMMPGMDGGTLTREACLARPGLLALVVTGYTEVEMLSGLPRHVQVLHKPLRGDALARHIASLLDRGLASRRHPAEAVMA